jgi:hypothetical protein
LATCSAGATRQVWMLPEPGGNLRIRLPSAVTYTIHDHGDMSVSCS